MRVFRWWGLKERGKLYAFYVSIFPLMVCSGMVYSILALYISELGASKTEIGMIYMTGSAVGALISPMVGRLSDRIGRKPVMAFSMVGFTLAFAAYSLIEDAVYAFPIQALEGATWAAMGTVASAFIADLAPESERGWAMGMYERTWFIGWIVGPMLGGYLADHVGFKPTLVLGSALTVLGLIVFLLKVKESR
ncbi:MAG: MFS transporter [Thermoprotei archaeon]|nr:MAG: MFS transporter [Thermoprotei archaeon]